MPEASVGSVAASPVIRIRIQSLGCSAHRAAATFSGSCSMSHERIGPAIPADGRFPRPPVSVAGNSRVAVGLEGGPLVEPQDRRPHRAACDGRQHHAVHLAGHG